MGSPVQFVSVRRGGCDGYTPAGRARAFLWLQSLAHTLHGRSFKVLPFQGGSAASLCFLHFASPRVWMRLNTSSRVHRPFGGLLR